MGLIIMILVGIAAGYVAGIIMNWKGMSIGINLLVGVVGAFIGNWIFSELGIRISHGLLGNFITALIGAVLLLFVINIFKRI